MAQEDRIVPFIWHWLDFSPKDFIQEASTVPPNIEQSPLCYIVSPCWLSILNIPVYTCWSQTKQTHFLSITLSLSEFFLWWDVKNPSFIKSWNQVHELRRPWVLTRVKSQPHAFRSQSTLHSFSSTGRSSAHTLLYFLSAIEDEFDFALGKQTPAFLKKCVCYIRKIANIERFVKIPEMGKYMDITGTR